MALVPFHRAFSEWLSSKFPRVGHFCLVAACQGARDVDLFDLSC